MTARSKPQSCLGCACHSQGTDFSDIEGTGSSGVLVCAEASGEMEARDQLPLRPYAPSGSVFERVLRRMSIDRQQLSVTNVVRCRPKNNWLEGAYYEYEAINHCRPNLDAAIRERKPRCIVALGGVALRELTGQAGEARGISHLCGYPLPLATGSREVRHKCEDCGDPPTPNCLLCGGDGYWTTSEPAQDQRGIPVIGDFHPAFIRRGKASHQGVFARVMQRAMNIAAGKDRAWLWNVDPTDSSTWGGLTCATRPSLDEAASFRNRILEGSSQLLIYDLETFESASLDEDAREGFADTNIRLVQFSGWSKQSIAFPWEGEYKRIAREILHSQVTKSGHNLWLFDNKVLRAAGEREGMDLMPRGVMHDTLQMFHHWQPDLPAHLQFACQFSGALFPWKHLAGTDIAFYGCMDVLNNYDLHVMLEATLRRDGLWGDATCGYLGQVHAVRPVLAAMEDRGLPIDDVARRKLDTEFDVAQRELGKVIAARAPAQCKRVHPKDGYKGVPPEVKVLDPVLWLGMDAGNGPDVQFTEPGEDGEQYRYQKRMFDVAAVVDGNPVVQAIERWCRVYDFNPNSGKQLIEYMKHKKHPVPKSKEEDEAGDKKDTTNKKELVRLARKVDDDFYLRVIEFRELGKARGTYVEGFKPHADGRVHPTFSFDTGTGQLAAKNPNSTNFPKHGQSDYQKKLVKALRRMVAAPEGHVLVEWDFKGYHALTTGFEAEDADYMRLARIDIHSFVAWNFMSKSVPIPGGLLQLGDEELADRLTWFKSDEKRKFVRDFQAKRSLLGMQFGMKKRRLYQENMEYYQSEAEAGKFLSLIEHLFPRVFAWQSRVQKLAHEQQFLMSRFGHLRRFYEVFAWDVKRGGWKNGDQAEEAIAFLPANHAFGNIRETLKELERRELSQRYGFCNHIHDSLLYCFPRKLLERHIEEVYPVLHAPSRVLTHPRLAPSGLVVDVEGNVGPNWAEMEVINLGGVSDAHANANPNPQPADVPLVPAPPPHVAAAQ